MKKDVCNLVITVACIMAVIPLMAPGCGEDNHYNVGYHSVPIPGFEAPDYMAMLENSNEDMQYNAICNLGYEGYEAVLGVDSLKGTGRYDTALMVYQKIYLLMESKNSWISSAAIHFINGFQYNRAAFVQSVLKNNNPSKNTQLEIITDISYDSAKDQRLLNEKIEFLQRQPSWLLQNGRYLMIGKKDNVPLNQLMSDYNGSTQEYKKLLILEVLAEHITDSVFSFLTNEWATTRNERIKNMIFSSLGGADNQQLVFQWFNQHDYMLEKGMDQLISHILDHEPGEIYGRLIVMALQKGWKPSSLVAEKDALGLTGEPLLYTYLFMGKYEEIASGFAKREQTPDGKMVEDALIRDPLLRNEWLNFEKRMLKERRPALPLAAISRHQQLTADYLRKTRLLLQQYNADTSVYATFKKSLNSEADVMYKTRNSKVGIAHQYPE